MRNARNSHKTEAMPDGLFPVNTYCIIIVQNEECCIILNIVCFYLQVLWTWWTTVLGVFEEEQHIQFYPSWTWVKLYILKSAQIISRLNARDVG